MLSRLHELARRRIDHAFETTLAGLGHARWLSRVRETGYEVHLYFLWLESADLAVARVANRVRAGGHDIPEDVIRRRWTRGIRNFFDRYQGLADAWYLLDASTTRAPVFVASGRLGLPDSIDHPARYESILLAAGLGAEPMIRERVREEDLERVARRLQEAVRAALLRHKLLGLPAVEGREGRVVWIPPHEIDVEPLPDRS